VFDGRLAEDFKLATGTWVSVGPLRARFLAHCAPYAQDVVIAAPDRDDVTALIFPNVEACRALGGGVRTKFQTLLEELAQTATGSASRIVRAILVEEPPSIDAHEVTDKGSLNQAAILRNRAHLVEELYAPVQSPKVLYIHK
jgi:feruloyl-CoA synthase